MQQQQHLVHQHQEHLQHQQDYLVDLHQQLYQVPLAQLTSEVIQQEHREHQEVNSAHQEQHLVQPLVQHQHLDHQEHREKI